MRVLFMVALTLTVLMMLSLISGCGPMNHQPNPTTGSANLSIETTSGLTGARSFRTSKAGLFLVKSKFDSELDINQDNHLTLFVVSADDLTPLDSTTVITAKFYKSKSTTPVGKADAGVVDQGSGYWVLTLNSPKHGSYEVMVHIQTQDGVEDDYVQKFKL